MCANSYIYRVEVATGMSPQPLGQHRWHDRTSAERLAIVGKLVHLVTASAVTGLRGFIIIAPSETTNLQGHRIHILFPLESARRTMPLIRTTTLSYSSSWGPNLTISECVRLIAQICSGLFSHGRQCVADDLVTRTAVGPVISHLQSLSYGMLARPVCR